MVMEWAETEMVEAPCHMETATLTNPQITQTFNKEMDNKTSMVRIAVEISMEISEVKAAEVVEITTMLMVLPVEVALSTLTTKEEEGAICRMELISMVDVEATCITGMAGTLEEDKTSLVVAIMVI